MNKIDLSTEKLKEQVKNLSESAEQLPQKVKDLSDNATQQIRNLSESAGQQVKNIADNAEQLPQKVKDLSDNATQQIRNLSESADQLPQKVMQIQKKMDGEIRNWVFHNLDDLPKGIASNHLTDVCLVLEGGAFRGLYTSGVCDALMEADINARCTIGVSAGALNGINYVAGQIGRAAHINLKYRNDPRYVGGLAYMQNHGIIGFDFLFGDAGKEYPLDSVRFYAPNRRFVAVATNCMTGQPEFFERGECEDILQACRASASMPFVSQMVYIGEQPYLDGGCSDAIPYQWAIDEGYDKIIIVRTRADEFRQERETMDNPATRTMYRNYPALERALVESASRYNKQCNDIEMLRRKKKVFVISPSEEIDIGRLERDTKRLGDVYYMGYKDTKRLMPRLKEYLNKGE